mgnify:CR=1 FL=1
MLDMNKILSQKELDKFHKDGFILIKNLFSKEETGKLRSHIDGLKESESGSEKNGSFLFVGDAVSKNLGNLVFDERIMNISKQILGPRLVYFGESTIQTGIRAGRGFHRDNADRENQKDPDWQINNFPIIKMGIYLADHKKFSGGLKVRKGSHSIDDFIVDPNNPSIKNQEEGRGKIYNIPSQAGDLILWSMRLAHSANFIRFKLLRNICLPPKIENKVDKYLPQFLQSKLPTERKTFWLTLGAPSPELDRYIKYYIERGDYVEHWKRCVDNDELLKLASTNNVEIRKPIPEYASLQLN